MLTPIPADERDVIWPLVGTRMLELGNKKNSKGTYKAYFESIDIDHTSIDWNGEDGALKLDLREPIDLKPFDMVTNIGTTEHVSDQEAVWSNIHNLTKVGGFIASVTPLEGDWIRHGEYYPRFEFFEQFTKNGYEIEHLEIDRIAPRRNVYARMKKIKHNDFVMPDKETMFINKPVDSI
jgi:SAM-dependent methyltransferase